MTSSTHTLLRFVAKLTRCLSLALLPALASEARALSAPQRKAFVGAPATARGTAVPAASTPYLAALGSLPLRFARPPLDLTDEPPPAPVPKSEPVAPETSDVTKNSDTPPAAPSEARPVEQPPVEKPAPPPEPPPAPALPILPDDTKRELRAEDVLLFFRYPNATASHGESRTHIVVPAPASQPQSTPIPSSATYQQK